MENKVCLVTGATNGIGKVTALELARRGATVVLAGRSAAKTDAVVAEIKARSGNDHVEGLVADLSTQAGVRALADAFKARYNRLDVLVNNAGAIFNERRESADGIEMTFALNHLSYFLLTHLLLDVLKASAPARIVNVSSNAHMGSGINFDDLEFKRGYMNFRAYAQSKLANILFTTELARRLQGTGVTANALHPGFVSSGFGRNDGSLMNIGMMLMRPFQISPEKGAETTLYLATSPEVEGVTGGYFSKRKPARTSSAARDQAAAERLWAISEQMTGVRAVEFA